MLHTLHCIIFMIIIFHRSVWCNVKLRKVLSGYSGSYCSNFIKMFERIIDMDIYEYNVTVMTFLVTSLLASFAPFIPRHVSTYLGDQLMRDITSRRRCRWLVHRITLSEYISGRCGRDREPPQERCLLRRLRLAPPVRKFYQRTEAANGSHLWPLTTQGRTDLRKFV